MGPVKFPLLTFALILQHDQSHSAHGLGAGPVGLIDSTTERRGAVVVEVVVQVAVTGAELLLVEEMGVVEEGEGVEHVELGLNKSATAQRIMYHICCLPASLGSMRP